MGKIKVLTVVGTRPELIRLSRLIPLLDEFTNHVLVHTGQNYDPALSDIFFEDLELRPPDYHLGIGGDSLGQVLGNLFPAIEKVLVEESPDAVAILGDTNSSLSAIIAERMGIPVYHMEAGNRSFDPDVPEELNRRLVDHISSFNLPYSEHARRNLLSEGLPARSIMLTGSPMREVFEHYWEKIESSGILEDQGLTRGEYFLASFHRQENTDSADRLRLIFEALRSLASEFGVPVLVSTHPRLAKRIEALSIDTRTNVRLCLPFNFSCYSKLQINAKCVISDSGSISEEAAILGFPAVTVRNSMERPEALESGSLVMAGFTSRSLLNAVEVSCRNGRTSQTVLDYSSNDFSQRVLNDIVSTVFHAKPWLRTATVYDS